MNQLDRELELVFFENKKQLYAFALSIVRCPDGAEDAIQEAFYRLFRMKGAPRNIRAYVFRAVRNAAIDQLRRSPQNHEELQDYIFDPGDDPSRSSEEKEFMQRVAGILLSLSENERETIVSHLYGDLTFREIAEMRNLSIGTVASWYQRGIEKVKEHLQNEEGVERRG